ncbi:type I polyketide synthase, partial [Streptomyces odontomachi]|uniref:type I polyketide synthase n=1 Tax=Streptomyces odontomachi TaxID=2944940 RepID=UPI00210AFFF7
MSDADTSPGGTDGLIAVIGYACRVPKASDPTALWELLRTGASGITEIPDSRPELATLSRAAVRHPALRFGGFLDDVAGFDADFFATSPREAAAMDPRQRLVLELGWEAVEHAGIVPGALAGSPAAVFVGASGDDYARLRPASGHANVDHLSFTGLNNGMLANRLSYFLRLRGPSLTVDTAQSSSLVAVHMACAALRGGEASTALAAGVNLNLAPESWLAMAELGALSPDGRCHTFDARANGFVRGEGGAAVLLKRLPDALADGDQVLAVIRGTAVNNDGGGPGLTVPDAQAQQELLRLAYADADVDPRDIQYVELHGTGTKVGDPVEAAALGAVLGAGRTPADALHVGSIKTNIGHLESAAGIVGLVKVVASIRHRELPPSIHFHEENPALSLASHHLRVRQETGAWPRPDRPLLAGVSSFGLGGTNAHVVLSDWPGAEPATPTPPARGRARGGALPWVLSGRTPGALRAQAARMLAHVDAYDVDAHAVEAHAVDAHAVGAYDVTTAADVGHALATSRTAFEHRAALVGAGKRDFVAQLEALRDGAATALTGRPVEGKLAFLFPGQGAQRVRAGAELYARFPVFAAAFETVCNELNPHLDRTVESIAFAPEGSADAMLLDETLYTQTCLFALEVSLFRLFEAWGIRPDHLLGHSIGELAAAHVAGVFSLADACALVAARGSLMQALPARGAMVSLQAGEAEVRESIGGHAGLVDIAAVNGPMSTVLSGEASAVADIAAGWAGKGRRTKRLNVSHAFHSPEMEPILAEFERVAAELTYRKPTIPLVSNLTGRVVTDDVLGPRYWARHVREAVRFADGVDSLYAAGVVTFVELGPGGGLSAMARLGAEERQANAYIPTLSARHGEAESVMAAVGRLHLRGRSPDWDALYGECSRVDLPTYPFQRERHWIDTAPPETQADDRPQSVTQPPRETAPDHRPAADHDIDVLQLIRSTAASVLGHRDVAAVDPGRAFKELGFDSIMLMHLLDGVNAATGLDLPTSVMFDHVNAGALARFVRAALTGTVEPSPEVVPAVPAVHEPLAIVGMACRFPGGVASPDDLWQVVVDGMDVISDFPEDRGWDVEGIYDPDPAKPGKTYVRAGGFLKDVAGFDAEFFGISPREALAMDPQQRLLLETSWEAVEHAGMDPTSLRGEQVGVFVGATTDEYGSALHEPLQGFDGYQLTGSTP